MAASGNDTPIWFGEGPHGLSMGWIVTNTLLTTSFTIQTPFVDQDVIVSATSEGTALVDTGSYAKTTGIVTITHTATDTVVVRVREMRI